MKTFPVNENIKDFFWKIKNTVTYMIKYVKEKYHKNKLSDFKMKANVGNYLRHVAGKNKESRL